MGFLKDLINGHEAFFDNMELKKEEPKKIQQNKLTLVEDLKEEAVKAA